MKRKSQAGLPLVNGTGRARKGFTLVELLVVVAIIAILAGILYPVFSQARAKAQQTACAANVKQLGTAIQIYVQDYDETFPPVYIDPANRTIPDSTLVDRPEWKGLSWTERVYPYVKNEEIFKCKSDPAAAQRNPVNARFLNSYAYNPLFGTQPDPVNAAKLAPGALTLAQLNNAADAALLWDTPINPQQRAGAQSKNNLSRSIADRRMAVNYLYIVDNSKKHIYAEEGTFTVAKEAPEKWMKPRHAESSNVLFADSHVKPVKDPVQGARNNDEVNEKLSRFFNPYYAGK
jgi:prepilin-type N-terminal cleavage/methylation domain-containing protein/prepilin-type processing-associated H-X9-DG protein